MMNSRQSNNWIRRSTVLGLLLLGALLQPQSALAVGPPPVITTQPLDQVVVAGDSATFFVEVSSVTTVSYQWLKDGIDIHGATGSAYTINPIGLADAGQYSVAVVNGGGMATSADATLAVLAPPTITTQPQGLTAMPGQDASFLVVASGTAPLRYQWHFNGAPLPGATNASLNLTNIQAPNAGSYTVVVANDYGSATSTVATLVFQSWVATYNGSWDGPDYLTATVVDAQGNVYVTGYADMVDSRTWDYVTAKYDSNGTLLWQRVYDGGIRNGDDKPTALVLDSAGNVYVTGSSEGDYGWDYATIKYDPDGDLLWVARFNGASNSDDQASALAVDGNGNVFVCGSSITGNKLRYATVKYDNAGQQLWVQTYAGPANSYDEARWLALDAAGNVYVTGLSKGISSGLDYATLKYSSQGSQLWVACYSGPTGGDDVPVQVVVDPNQNVYVTGTSSGLGSDDYATVKYGPDGTQLWVARYSGPTEKDDGAVALALDPDGNLIVTGASDTAVGESDYATVKYSPLGEQLWAVCYDGPAMGDDQAKALTLDPAGDVYVTGTSKGSGPGCDFATVKYLNTDGSQAWVARFDSGNNDTAVAMAVDHEFNVYVGGQAYDPLDFTLVKYQSALFPANVSAPCTLWVEGSGGMTAEGFSFGLSVPVGATFVIEASSNGRDWTPIATNVAASANLVFTDPAAANFPMRFYRAVLLSTTSATQSGSSNQQDANEQQAGGNDEQ